MNDEERGSETELRGAIGSYIQELNWRVGEWDRRSCAALCKHVKWGLIREGRCYRGDACGAVGREYR